MITTSISKFSELIKDHEFFIPNYQRAYSWTEKEIAQFIADIVEHAEIQTNQRNTISGTTSLKRIPTES